MGANSVLDELTSFEKGGKKENGRVAFPENMSILTEKMKYKIGRLLSLEVYPFTLKHRIK